MILKVLLVSLSLVVLATASAPASAEDQTPDKAVGDGYNRYPYYTGYPFYHSGYPFYHGAYPFHYPAGRFPGYYPYYAPVVQPHAAAPYGDKYVYRGTFDGHCVHDGLYYVDERSFAFCHHGQRTVQSCADGAANKQVDNYKSGSYYTMDDFCSINLLAEAAEAKNKEENKA